MIVHFKVLSSQTSFWSGQTFVLSGQTSVLSGQTLVSLPRRVEHSLVLQVQGGGVTVREVSV